MIRPTDDDVAATPRYAPWYRGPMSFYHQPARNGGYRVRDKVSGITLTCDTLAEGAGAMRDALRARQVTFDR